MGIEGLEAWQQARSGADKPFAAACYAPFVSLEFDTQGFAYTCCANGTYPVGNVATDTLDDIWRGARIAAQRDALRRNDLNYGCTVCSWYFANGKPDPLAAIYEPFPVSGPEPDLPLSLAFSFSNQCNLQCIQCSGEYSSSIRAHREGRPALPHAYGDAFFEQLPPYLRAARSIRLMGGEPFLVSETYRLFDLLAAEGLTPAVHLTTNGTRMDRRVEAAFAQLPLSISVSIDAISPEVLEATRVGVVTAEVLANARRFKELTASSGGTFGINSCLMRSNWRELPALLRFGDELDAWVSVITVHNDEHSLYKLPADELAAILAELEASLDPSELGTNRPVWEAELAQLRSALEDARAGRVPPMLEPGRDDEGHGLVARRLEARPPVPPRAEAPAPARRRWWPSTRRPSPVDPQAPAVDAARRADDLARSLERWAVGGSVVSVDTDADDVVVAVAVHHGTPPSVEPHGWAGRPFLDVVAELRDAWGGHLWSIEDERPAPDHVHQLVAFSPTPHREKRGAVVRIEVLALSPDRWRTYLAIDPSFLGEPGVAVSITGSSAAR